MTEKPLRGDDGLKNQESAENYLETILILSRKSPNVRSIDIVNELEYTKPSVSVAMKNLREKGCIEMDPDGYITLTDRGRDIAESVYERHTLISEWFVMLGVHEKVALEDACRIEHVISSESFEAIKKHVYQRRYRESQPQNI
jgi:DtxR family Mn-dependent transcriptional regulator